jgi:hypothetical protein
MKPVIQKVTSDQDDIPKQYVPLASFGCHSGARPATRKYLILSEAWKNKRLSGWKLMSSPQDVRGKVFIDPGDAARLLSEAEDAEPSEGGGFDVEQAIAASKSSANSSLILLERVHQVVAVELREISSRAGILSRAIEDVDATLNRMVAVAERIATAAEALATQPQTAQQELLRTISGNGFHS